MKELGYGLAGLVLLAAIYLGSYYGMVTPGGRIDPRTGEASPEYRFGGDAAEAFYFPVFTLDRKLRPERWPTMPDLSIESLDVYLVIP